MLALYANNSKIKLDKERAQKYFSRFLCNHRAVLLPFGAVLPDEDTPVEALPPQLPVAQPAQMIMQVNDAQYVTCLTITSLHKRRCICGLDN